MGNVLVKKRVFAMRKTNSKNSLSKILNFLWSERKGASSAKRLSSLLSFRVSFRFLSLIAATVTVPTIPFSAGCSFDPSGVPLENANTNDNDICGDGIITGDQECDDGNIRNGDGCSSECQIEEGWECSGEPSVCNPICGDGLIYGDEECDDGNTISGDGCADACEVEPGYTCTGQPSVCTISECGDGEITGNEACDDGNTEPGDGCDENCEIEPGYVCEGEPSVCAAVCGDGIITDDEECDDNNGESGDGCSEDCRIEEGWECSSSPSICTPICGDAIIVGDEECDDNNLNDQTCIDLGYYGGELACSDSCMFDTAGCEGMCGDGEVNGTEECDGDDLNNESCENFGYYGGELNCTNTCEFDTSGCEGMCGDSEINGTEECDGNNLGNTSCQDLGYYGGDLACSDTCQFDSSGCEGNCGDGEITGSEECDGDNLNDATCQDLGYYSGDLACTDTCQFDASVCSGYCGDGIINGTEECDDQNATLGDGCSDTCEIEHGFYCEDEPSVCSSTCGDGLIASDEECDDNNTEPGDGCSDVCLIEEGWDCINEPSDCTPDCGDGIIVGNEECDGNNLNDQTCEDQGYYGGDLACTDTCQFDASACSGYCGDGIINGTEECDDQNTAPSDGCSDACEVEPYFNCEGEPSECACVVYVDKTATSPDPDGKSWLTAYNKVQEGIEQADALSPTAGLCEVWVAQSTYYIYDTSADNTVTLANNVAVYGGFDGTETSRDQRDWEANETILHGADNGEINEQVRHVVSALSTTDATMDGFTVTMGLSDGFGAGLYATSASNLYVENCVFEENEATGGDGGGAYLSDGSAFFHNSVFRTNEASNEHGGGVYITAMDLSLASCTFGNNMASKMGGGIYAVNGSVLTAEDCTLTTNTAESGGGVWIKDGSASFHNTTFDNNEALNGDGGSIFNENTELSLSNCDGTNNIASKKGGFLFMKGPEANTDIWTSTFGPGNYSDDRGGVVFLDDGDIAIYDSLFEENETIKTGGALHIKKKTAFIENTIFRLNICEEKGGAIFGEKDGTTTIINSLFNGNVNLALDEGGGIHNNDGIFDIANSIFWNNLPDQISEGNNAATTVQYSIIQGGFVGPGNKNQDPLFDDETNGDYHLQSGSPCIDAADGTVAPEFDIEGNPRVDDPATDPNTGIGTPDYVDIGPYEYQP